MKKVIISFVAITVSVLFLTGGMAFADSWKEKGHGKAKMCDKSSWSEFEDHSIWSRGGKDHDNDHGRKRGHDRDHHKHRHHRHHHDVSCH